MLSGFFSPLAGSVVNSVFMTLVATFIAPLLYFAARDPRIPHRFAVTKPKVRVLIGTLAVNILYYLFYAVYFAGESHLFFQSFTFAIFFAFPLLWISAWIYFWKMPEERYRIFGLPFAFINGLFFILQADITVMSGIGNGDGSFVKASYKAIQFGIVGIYAAVGLMTLILHRVRPDFGEPVSRTDSEENTISPVGEPCPALNDSPL